MLPRILILSTNVPDDLSNHLIRKDNPVRQGERQARMTLYKNQREVDPQNATLTASLLAQFQPKDQKSFEH